MCLKIFGLFAVIYVPSYSCIFNAILNPSGVKHDPEKKCTLGYLPHQKLCTPIHIFMQQGVIDKAPFQKSINYTSQMGELYVDILFQSRKDRREY